MAIRAAKFLHDKWNDAMCGSTNVITGTESEPGSPSAYLGLPRSRDGAAGRDRGLRGDWPLTTIGR
jgi:hypothetical protein